MQRLIILLFCFFTTTAQAQNTVDTLQAFGSGADLYLYHTVQKGDNFFSLGRMYHVSPHAIATNNHLTFNNPLRLSSVIKIPLASENFFQQTSFASAQLTPVYHKVIKGETLYHVSITYNKAPLNNIRAWNHLDGNNISVGQYLIVGWLRYDNNIVQANTNVANNSIVTKSPVTNQQSNIPRTITSNAVIKQQEKIPENNTGNKSFSIPPPILTRADSGITFSKSNANNNTTVISPLTGSPFESAYIQETNVKELAVQKGAGAWFASNIPPGSKKYYVLFNDAVRGDIIKIINPLNGKFIYAKVLDAIPKLGANANLIVKISDAAKEDLGISDERFYCEVDYGK